MIDIILDEEGFMSVSINGREVIIEDQDEENVFIECSLKDLEGVRFEEISGNLVIRIHESDGFDTGIFHEASITSEGVEFIHHFPNKYWEGKWGLGTFLNALKQQADFEEDITVGDYDFEDDWKRLNLYFNAEPTNVVASFIQEAAKRIKGLIVSSEISLGGISWKREYEKDEALFCLEILLPLLRRMGFLSVRYSHGQKEYGKDFTFSELTPFGDLRHYGLQAKAGKISGGVNSEIDELIGQIDDAFRMPYYELGSRDPRYISIFIIAISGRFTENAKEKIVHKIPNGLVGSVYFLDKDKIIELIERYWLTK